jgi:hypothetical protein
VAKGFSVKYWPALVIITGSVLSAAAFCELTRAMPCWCEVLLHSAGIVAAVLRPFCPVAGIQAHLCTCIWGSLKVLEVLLQIGEAVKPFVVCAAII